MGGKKKTTKNLASRSEGKRPAEKDPGWGKKTQNLASRSEGKTCGERAKGKK